MCENGPEGSGQYQAKFALPYLVRDIFLTRHSYLSLKYGASGIDWMGSKHVVAIAADTNPLSASPLCYNLEFGVCVELRTVLCLASFIWII